MVKAEIIFVVVCFLILYVIAWCSGRGYREEDNILGVSRNQWRALFALWISILIATILRGD